jgi:hypothetical protein
MVKSMPQEVPDTEENMNICKQFCGPCPTFKPNKLNEVEPHALFCARGASEKPQKEIEEKACNCFDCGVFKKYDLKGGWFCIYGTQGKE